MRVALRRRSFLAGAGGLAASLTAPAPAITQPARVLKAVPQANLTSIDPIWTTANITSNLGHMVYDMQYGIDQHFVAHPQMAACHLIEEDGRRVTIAGRPARHRRRHPARGARRGLAHPARQLLRQHRAAAEPHRPGSRPDAAVEPAPCVTRTVLRQCPAHRITAAMHRVEAPPSRYPGNGAVEMLVPGPTGWEQDEVDALTAIPHPASQKCGLPPWATSGEMASLIPC